MQKIDGGLPLRVRELDLARECMEMRDERSDDVAQPLVLSAVERRDDRLREIVAGDVAHGR